MQAYGVGNSYQGHNSDTNEDAMYIDDELGLFIYIQTLSRGPTRRAHAVGIRGSVDGQIQEVSRAPRNADPMPCSNLLRL